MKYMPSYPSPMSQEWTENVGLVSLDSAVLYLLWSLVFTQWKYIGPFFNFLFIIILISSWLSKPTPVLRNCSSFYWVKKYPDFAHFLGKADKHAQNRPSTSRALMPLTYLSLLRLAFQVASFCFGDQNNLSGDRLAHSWLPSQHLFLWMQGMKLNKPSSIRLP